MELKELQNKQIKRGVYHKATWKSVKVINGVEYTKVSNGVIRIVDYHNIKEVKAKLSEKAPTTKKTNTNKQWIIKDLLSFNTNTQRYSVQFGTTKVKPHSTCYANGVEISRQDYDMVIAPSKDKNPIFNVLLENVISID